DSFHVPKILAFHTPCYHDVIFDVVRVLNLNDEQEGWFCSLVMSSSESVSTMSNLSVVLRFLILILSLPGFTSALIKAVCLRSCCLFFTILFLVGTGACTALDSSMFLLFTSRKIFMSSESPTICQCPMATHDYTSSRRSFLEPSMTRGRVQEWPDHRNHTVSQNCSIFFVMTVMRLIILLVLGSRYVRVSPHLFWVPQVYRSCLALFTYFEGFSIVLFFLFGVRSLLLTLAVVTLHDLKFCASMVSIIVPWVLSLLVLFPLAYAIADLPALFSWSYGSSVLVMIFLAALAKLSCFDACCFGLLVIVSCWSFIIIILDRLIAFSNLLRQYLFFLGFF
ncbi:hypothetical protein L9F63_024805, partial [Diploptera punctata]